MILKVLRVKPEDKDVFSVILEKPPGFTFYTGQYLNVELHGDTRDFTISSSPAEDFLMITTKKSISQFKKSLESLTAGDIITTSHPAGTFILDETESAVFMAGGIGITPFRSMIKYALDHNLKTPITLINSNSDDNFLFKEELDNWQKSYPNLTIIYHNSTRSGHLSQLPPTPYHLPIYYLAGPPKMVDDFEKMLLDLGVEETNIRYDRFDGY